MQGDESTTDGGPRVVIVGAGITGLALTHALRKRGISVQTYEAADRPGGVIRSSRIDDSLLEYGPQRLRLSDPLERLVDDLSLREHLQFAPTDAPLYVLKRGELCEVPRDIRSFLRTDLLSLPAKLRVLAEPVTNEGQADETAGELLTRKFGQETYHNMIEPLLGGIYASDPHTMPATHALAPILSVEGSLLKAAFNRIRTADERTPAVSFDNGLAVLPHALYEEHRDVIDLDTRVQSIANTAYGPYRVKTTDGGVTTDIVILTAPARNVANILSGHPDSAVDGLKEIQYNPLAVVHLQSDVQPHGFGYQVRRSEPLETLGVTWNSALFERDGVFTAFLGGVWNPDIVDQPVTEIGEVARTEFTRIMDADATVLDVSIMEQAIPAYDHSWKYLQDLSFPDGILLATNYTGRVGVSGRLREAEQVADRIAAGDVHGKRL